MPNVDLPSALVAAACGEALTVRAERHAPDRAGEAVQGRHVPIGRQVPDFHYCPAGGGEVFAVRAEGHAKDVVGMPGEIANLFTSSRVPDLHLLVRPAGCQHLAVGAEGHDMYPAGVSGESSDALPVRVTELDGLVHAARGGALPVRDRRTPADLPLSARQLETR